MAETAFWHCIWHVPRHIHIGRITNVVLFENMKINMQAFMKMATHKRTCGGSKTWGRMHFMADPKENRVSLQIRAPDQVSARAGNRGTVRHGIEFFSLEKASLMIYTTEVKSQTIQSMWTGKFFSLFVRREGVGVTEWNSQGTGVRSERKYFPYFND